MIDFSYFRKVWQDLKQHGNIYILTDILFKILSFLIWVPLISWGFSTLINLSGKAAISNTDIALFILSPVGLLAILFISITMLGLFFAEHALLITISFSAQNGKDINWMQAFILLRQKGLKLLIIGASYIITLIVIALPILLIIGYLYLNNLTQFDINYYLSERPAEFMKVLYISLPLVIFFICTFAYLYIAWLFAIPMILFESDHNLLTLLRKSRKRVKGYWWHIAWVMALWWVFLFLAAMLYQFIIEDWLSSSLFALSGERSSWVITAMGLMFLLELVFNLTWQLIGIIGSAIIVTHLYINQAQKHNIWTKLPDSSKENNYNFNIKKFFPLALMGGIIFSGLIAYGIVKDVTFEDHTIIIAHRGASLAAPPNSKSSILKAIEIGADIAEIDVQETADGIVIVHHDKDYMLTSNIAKAVHELDYETTKNIDIGSSFSSDYATEKVITLEEALNIAKGKIKVLIELKYYGYDQNLEQKVLDIVCKADMEDQVQYMSLNLEKIKNLKALNPTVQAGYIASAATLGDLTKIDVDFLAVASSIGSDSFIKRAQQANKNVYIWTVDDITSMNLFLDYQSDGIITNKPDLLKSVINERIKMTNAERLISLYYSYWEH